MQTFFDLGLFDAADTAYYLSLGVRVIAVDANPDLAASARRRFATDIAAGHLVVIAVAVSDTMGEVELVISGRNAGGSSIVSGWGTDERPVGTIAVPAVTIGRLIAEYGVPTFCKVDIEGADGRVVMGLTADTAPRFLSFEAGVETDALVRHCTAIGYRGFKIMNQCLHRTLPREHLLSDRIARKLMRLAGYDEPLDVKRAGRFFRTLSSSGPVPWQSDGRWESAEAVLARWPIRDPNATYDVQCRHQ
jgi:FkbM family methyltransferase